MTDRVSSASEESGLRKIVKVDEAEVQKHLDGMVRQTVEATLNALLEAEAAQLCGAARYERTDARKDYRAGHYERELQTKAGPVSLKMPKLRSLPFETAIIERYRRRESSVEEALVEMYLAGVSVRRVEDITEALWGTKVSPSTVSELNQRIYVKIEEWRSRPLTGRYPYVYLDGLWLKRSWGGEVRQVAVLVAVGVDEEGYREVLGVAEGAKEDTASWREFLRQLKGRGLTGVRLVISDKCLGLVEALGEFYPEAAWQRCTVHFYRNVLAAVPQTRVREAAAMLKAIHAQEDRGEAEKKAQAVAARLEGMKLVAAAKVVREGAGETLSYYAFPREHWRKIRTNNPLERVLREVRRRTRAVGSFPDGRSALMLVAARLRHVAGTKWGSQRYMEMKWLRPAEESAGAVAALPESPAPSVARVAVG
jgi:transposase-like protein